MLIDRAGSLREVCQSVVLSYYSHYGLIVGNFKINFSLRWAGPGSSLTMNGFVQVLDSPGA